MRLIVHEVQTSVFQTLRHPSNLFVGAVRPHIYLHNNPSGNLKVQICSSDGEVLAESSAINFSTIASDIEFHGYVTFYVDASLRKDTDYQIKIVAGGGYSFSEAAYCGVCADYDSRKYDPPTPDIHPWISPLDIEIWSRSSK